MSLFVAKTDGRPQRPARYSSVGSSVLADAKRSAGAPASICRCSSPDPPKL